MATTTPNFGWSVPTSTDLVKDGATAIETLGDSIDASLLDLKGGTSGQVLAKNSNTDMDFVWVTTDDTNAIQNAIVDAKGDLISATAADTPARLAVGTNGQILTADSTEATGLKWVTAASSGGMTLLSTTTLTGASTTISSISGAYKALLIYVYGVTNATSDNSFFVYPNSVTNTAYSTGTIAGSANNSAASSGIPIYWNGNPDRTSANNASTIWIYNYASTTNYKNHQVNSVYQKSGSVIEYNSLGGGLTTNSAITALQFISSGGSLSSGTVLIYGVN